jgi:predicted RNA binding protein YcfA (HicA-like mRNA interferase family)
MNWNEMKRKAIEHGFVFDGHGKKHDIYYNPKTGRTILIERHWSQEVRKGLMYKLKKDIGF